MSDGRRGRALRFSRWRCFSSVEMDVPRRSLQLCFPSFGSYSCCRRRSITWTLVVQPAGSIVEPFYRQYEIVGYIMVLFPILWVFLGLCQRRRQTF